MEVQKFTVRTTRAAITTWATSEHAARDIVAKAEGCPESAIVSVACQQPNGVFRHVIGLPTDRDYFARHDARRAAFRASPILESFLATALQDMQYREADEACTEEREERDSGTIYGCPDSTFKTARDMVARFESECAQAIAAAGELEPGVEGYSYARHYMTADRIGSTLYLACVGSGVGFLDDGDADCLKAMDAWAGCNSLESPYFGDDGKAYFA